jgi:4-amino-4-deoxy-L-arabinose transferase-like glycosyltransferase
MTGLWVFILVLAVISVVIACGTAYFAYNKAWVLVAALLCLLIGGVWIWWNWATIYKNDHWATCHITDKDRGADNGSYRVYTSDCGQLSNEDSLFRRKFNTADIWQEIPREGVVKLRIAGSRIPVFSHFPNIFEVEKVNQG